MTAQTLIEQLQTLPPSTQIMIVSGDFAFGDDTYAPLDHFMQLDGHMLLGATPQLCGSLVPEPMKDQTR